MLPGAILMIARLPHYFWLGEVGMAAVLAGVFAGPCRDLSHGKNGDSSRIHLGNNCFHAAGAEKKGLIADTKTATCASGTIPLSGKRLVPSPEITCLPYIM